MATRIRPLLTTGAALAGAAAIVVATPTIAPTLSTASVPVPPALSAAQYELAGLETLTTLTLADWQDAVFFGHGGGVTFDNPYYPYAEKNYPLYSAAGLPGAFYLAADALLNGTGKGTQDLDNWTNNTLLNYAEELGPTQALQVLLQKTLGTNPAISQLISLAFNFSVPALVI